MNTSNKSARGRSTAVKSQIDENLKRVYEHALNEEVPDRFKDLLDQLRRGSPPAPAETMDHAASGSASETTE